jgi:phosphate transport system permease protein
MMLPFVARSSQEVLRIVPNALREAGAALGAPQWRLALRVVLPTARAGLFTVAVLGIARAVGETAAVLLNAGGSAHQSINWNPFHGIQLDLPLFVYQFANVSSKNEVREAWGGALVLVLLVLLLFGLARLLGSGSLGKTYRSMTRGMRPPWRRSPLPNESL